MKRAISIEGNIIGKLTLFNDNGDIRWKVNLIKHDEGYYAIEEATKYSLFPNPLTTGPTMVDCMNWFLENEESLIDSL